MSGFFLIFHRNGRQADPEDLTWPVQQLAHRGPDGVETKVEGPLACAFFHFWTTLEEFGETQPLFHQPTGQWLLFDGRIDNRSSLLAQFTDNDKEAAIPDSQLAMNVLAKKGIGGLPLFIGPFALALIDPKKQSVLLARDPVGDRTLFYYQNPDYLAVASEECALLKVVESPALNPRRVTAFFDLSVPDPNDTFFEGISELPPGRYLLSAPDGSKQRAFWEFQPQPSVQYQDERGCIETFQTLLHNAVKSRLRSRTPIGIMMSGGLDSTTIAALARQEMLNRQNQGLKTFSYVFQNLPACDESKEIEGIANHLDLETNTFQASQSWPASSWADWPVNPNTPEDNLYRRLLMGIQSMAAGQDCRVLLTGDFGDHHFAGYHWWIWHALRDGHHFKLPGWLWSEWRRTDWRTTLRRGGIARVFAPKKRHCPPYLTPHAQKYWQQPADIEHCTRTPTYRANALLGHINARSVSAESHRAAKAKMDVRHPFRDRRLLQFSLELPAYYLYRGGVKKYLLSQISNNFVPQNLRSSGQNLEAFFQLALRKEAKTIRNYLERYQDSWQPWVQPGFVFASLAPKKTASEFPLLWWQCLTFGKWLEEGIL